MKHYFYALAVALAITSGQQALAGHSNFGRVKIINPKLSFGHGFRPGKGFTQPPPSSTPPPTQPAVSNVRSFGAKGDGSTDDTAAIQAAAQDASNNNRTLYFPSGTYVHSGILTFTSINVAGQGASSILKAGDQTNSAVKLTGLKPSLQNLLVTTAQFSSGGASTAGGTASVLVANAAEFSISNCTLVQGANRTGVFCTDTIGGTIAGSVFDGAGSMGEVGVGIIGASYITVTGNTFQNEATGVSVSQLVPGQPCEHTSVLSNQFGNTSYPTLLMAISDQASDFSTIRGNIIQMANVSANTYGMLFTNATNMTVTQNTIYGGSSGIFDLTNVGPASITQNTIYNSGGAGILILTVQYNTGLNVSNNTFGECGLTASANLAVINVNGLALNDPSTLAITNNTYAGHLNHLNFYILSNQHLVTVSGNTQTQTALTNSIP